MKILVKKLKTNLWINSLVFTIPDNHNMDRMNEAQQLDLEFMKDSLKDDFNMPYGNKKK